jgi:hypothetical protein
MYTVGQNGKAASVTALAVPVASTRIDINQAGARLIF